MAAGAFSVLGRASRRELSDLDFAGVGGNGHGGSSSVAVGFRHVDDDSLWLAGFFLLDGGEGAEEEVAGIGHDGGAARGDAVLGLKKKEAGKEIVDGDGGTEFSETGDEFGGEIGGFVPLLPAAGMVGAKGGEMIRDRQAAAAVAGVVLAAAIG